MVVVVVVVVVVVQPSAHGLKLKLELSATSEAQLSLGSTMRSSASLVAKGKAMSVADRPRMPVLASSCAYPERSDTKIAAVKNGSWKHSFPKWEVMCMLNLKDAILDFALLNLTVISLLFPCSKSALPL